MTTAKGRTADVKVTKERMLGTERRWRRFGEPVPAGGSLKEDDSPDYGLFGPGSVVWDVLLHPATIFFHHVGQATAQDLYQPIPAGARDWEPISRKARQGTLTVFDMYERVSRGAGMHLPMWLGDTTTAQRMAKHLHNVHRKVAGDVIDVSRPELGGYAANEPRDAMWAALTEMHPMLRMYEAFAFRDGKLPHRLSPEKRDRFMAEVAAYCRLHGAPEDEIPTTMAELAALYAKYDDLFTHSKTIHVSPETGEDIRKVMGKSCQRNFHISQLHAVLLIFLLYLLVGLPATGAFSGRARRAMGVGPIRDRIATASTKLALPFAWLVQQPRIERYVMRVIWGPDGVVLFESARALHRKALAE
jgi:uncharacterized protein (DUF2236 family)